MSYICSVIDLFLFIRFRPNFVNKGFMYLQRLAQLLLYDLPKFSSFVLQNHASIHILIEGVFEKPSKYVTQLKKLKCHSFSVVHVKILLASAAQ